MSYNNGRITAPIVNPNDTKTVLVAKAKDIGGQVLEGVNQKKANKWAKIKPIPVLNDYTGKSLVGARIGQVVNGIVGGNTYNLRNDATGDSRMMPGYVGNVVNTPGTNGKGFITVCGLKLPYFPAASGETTGLSECCSAMQGTTESVVTADTYNWPYEWTSGWYRFADFENYNHNATFPFNYTAPETVNNGTTFSVSISNYNVTSVYNIGPSDLAYALQGWKFAVILMRTPVSATSSPDYTLIEGPAMNTSLAEISIDGTLIQKEIYSGYKVFFVLKGNILSEPKVIPLPYDGSMQNCTPIKTVAVNTYLSDDVLSKFNIAIEAFGYDATTIGKTVSISENHSLSAGKCPATNDRLMLKVTLTNNNQSASTAGLEDNLTHANIGWAISDGTLDFNYPADYLIYDSSGTAVQINDIIKTLYNQSVTFYYVFNPVWPTTPQDGTSVTNLTFGMAWIDSRYSGGYLVHMSEYMQVNSPSNSADSGRVGNLVLGETGLVVGSYSDYQ